MRIHMNTNGRDGEWARRRISEFSPIPPFTVSPLPSSSLRPRQSQAPFVGLIDHLHQLPDHLLILVLQPRRLFAAPILAPPRKLDPCLRLSSLALRIGKF